MNGFLAQKVDVSWFSRLFKAYNGSTEVAPNQSGTINNIKAMFGFWTDQYLSALGKGSSSGSMIDEAMMWSLLANNDSTKQISISHLTSALSGYMQSTSALTDIRRASDGILIFIRGGNAGSVSVDLRHTHVWSDISGRPTNLSQFTNDLSFYTYLGTTRLNLGNAAGSVTSVAGLTAINTNALVLRAITYNSTSYNAVGIGMTPSFPLDVAGRARFSGDIVSHGSSSDATLASNSLSFAGSGLMTCYLRRDSAYLALSFSGSGAAGLLVNTNNSVRFTAGAWSDTYLSALGQNTSSDIRMKTELGTVDLSVENVASAPMVRYLWKDHQELGPQVGSYAQAWQRILPEAVKKGPNGMLEMQYGVIALLASIATARKVKDHERRIKELEDENKKLKKQLKSMGYVIQ